jgi:3-oxoacyl-[acyl-carrier-protein] synthase II
MNRTRVVITGIGTITSLGFTVEEFWRNLLAGKSGISVIENFPTEGFSVRFGAEIKKWDPSPWMDFKEAKRMDRFAQFAMAAGIEAIKDSGIDFSKSDVTRCGAIMGSGIGGLDELQNTHSTFIKKGPRRMSPFFIPRLMINAAPGQIAIRYKLQGPNFSTVSACASANHAMGCALRSIQSGESDVIVTGGSEAALTYLGLTGFAAMGALSKRNDDPPAASRPFDKDRDGFVLSEGAAVFVFEKLEHAKARGAKIYAEVEGFGQSDDGYHLTAPEPEGVGAILAMESALRDARLKPEQIDYINAHGTSTALNDKAETTAIKKVFGEHARKVAINSTKSMIGHMLGAAAAVEAAAMVLSIRDQKIHPTINYETADPDCDLSYTPNEARELKIDHAMSNSLGFGGHNSVLIVGRLKE